MKRQNKATIRDVARIAQVSSATVSRVLNGTAKVNPDKERAVLQAIAETGFTVSASARQLATGKVNSIAVILTESVDELLVDPTYATVLKGIIERLTHTPMTPTLHMAATVEERHKSLQLFKQGAADAVIHLSPYRGDSFLAELSSIGCPVVLCGQVDDLPDTGNFSCVYSDDIDGATKQAQHLLSKGAHQIYALMGPADNPATKDRLNGLRSTLSSALCDPIFYGSWDEDSGLRMAGELLASSASFDAIACGNDRIALGVIRRLEMEGIRVPDDVLVIGFDDHPVAARTAPSITSVQQQFKHQGVRAVEIALSMLEGNGPVTEILKTRIQERESTSPSNAL